MKEVIQKLLNPLINSIEEAIEEETLSLINEVKEEIKKRYNIEVDESMYEIIYFDRPIKIVKDKALCLVILLSLKPVLELRSFAKFICLKFEENTIKITASESIGFMSSNINEVIKELEKVAYDVH